MTRGFCERDHHRSSSGRPADARECPQGTARRRFKQTTDSLHAFQSRQTSRLQRNGAEPERGADISYVWTREESTLPSSLTSFPARRRLGAGDRLQSRTGVVEERRHLASLSAPLEVGLTAAEPVSCSVCWYRSAFTQLARLAQARPIPTLTL